MCELRRWERALSASRPSPCPLQVSDARFKQADALVQLRQAGDEKERRWKALIGAPRVGGTIECGCGGRACIGGGAQRCCLLRCAYAESVKAHEKESHGRNDSDKAVMEVRT